MSRAAKSLFVFGVYLCSLGVILLLFPNWLLHFFGVPPTNEVWIRINGIGGVFFKSRNDSAALAAWYQEHLGIPLESFGGAVLRWPDDKAEDKGLTVWHIAEKESQWFSPSGSSFMINYRVDDLGEMIAQLRAGGVEIIQ